MKFEFEILFKETKSNAIQTNDLFVIIYTLSIMITLILLWEVKLNFNQIIKILSWGVYNSDYIVLKNFAFSI